MNACSFFVWKTRSLIRWLQRRICFWGPPMGVPRLCVGAVGCSRVQEQPWPVCHHPAARLQQLRAERLSSSYLQDPQFCLLSPPSLVSDGEHFHIFSTRPLTRLFSKHLTCLRHDFIQYVQLMTPSIMSAITSPSSFKYSCGPLM